MTPIVGLLLNGVDFTNLSFKYNDAENYMVVLYKLFLTLKNYCFRYFHVCSTIVLKSKLEKKR